MRAVVQRAYGGPEALALEEVAAPRPGKGEVLIAVRACGLNLSDLEFLTGRPAYARLGGLFGSGRRILGSDIVGEVVALGPGTVTGLAPGQRVMADAVMQRGGFAERVCLPARLCAPVPEGLSDEVAASLPQPGAIALQGMAGVRPGMRVLINGAGGGSGTLALQLARAAGAHVTVVDRRGKLGFLAGLGADAGLDYQAQDFAATGQVWDLILDMVATRGPGAVARALAPGGIYRAVGGPLRTILPLAVLGPLHRGRRIGVMAVRTGAEVTAAVAQAAVEGRLTPVIEAVLALDGLAPAMARMAAGEVLGKIVIRP